MWLIMVVIIVVVLSLQEFFEARSRELQTKEQVKARGQWKRKNSRLRPLSKEVSNKVLSRRGRNSKRWCRKCPSTCQGRIAWIARKMSRH